ncbi:TonB-dependent receptor [Zobellia galactanivorans]|uniref:TonB-dependent receptor domain-containing protein n=1 Tax=Zobellia galactanivorans (strain DSM 12802 / CCUG 47099 / CIP 106680 / NCIMB 13871 / Dsij) TaxID=63186 RepID=UPI0026E428B2|nr:TonB-dependent receptor [Zobellia galactanivorans]MDO6807754.1 TonB-dependent receptor [Zobellia galactanivorans]
MRKTFLITLLLLSINAFAQRPQRPQGQERQPIKITGTVLDKDNGDPLEYATLVLQSVDNPEKVTGGITDIDGKFSVETLPGKYNISVEYISYKTYKLPNQLLKESTDLGTVKLALDVAQLEGVEVVGEKTTVEVRLDKKIYNIGKDLTTSGATISDALNNVPSVNVDVEGAISLRGNENVRILINGKPSALAGFGSTDALRELPADAIEKVEVITSPSARYDAEGTAGILNIVLKREKTLGFNGSVSVNIGYPSQSSMSVNANLRTNKFNVFNTLGYRYNESPGHAFYENSYNDGQYDQINENRDYTRSGKGFNNNFGVEYFFNEKSSLTGSFFMRFQDGDDLTENYSDYFESGLLTRKSFREEIELEDEENYQFSLNYVNNIDDDGQKLTADLQYSNGDEVENSTIDDNNTFPNTSLNTLESIYQNEIDDEYLVQADYVLPMGDAQFEVGYRGTFEREITDYKLDSLNRSTNQFVTNEDLTNKFTYQENVNALYTQYGNKFGKFSFLAGLRLENTQLKGEVTSDFDTSAIEDALGEDVDLNFDKNYLGLFPTLNLIFEIGEMENISLGYNRRINRPRGRFINPFPSRASRANIFQGNPDLDPAYSNSFDLGYLKRWDKLTLTSSVYYKRETNSFEYIQEATGQTTTDSVRIIRSLPINLSSNERIGAEAGVLYNPKKWLRLNGSVNFFQFSSEGEHNGTDYGTDNTSWFARFSSKVSLPEKIEWQTNAFYMGPRQNSQTETKGMLSLNLAFSKDIMKDKGTVSLNVSDLLNSRKRQSYTVSDDFTSRSEFQFRPRSINLSFRYRINQSKDRDRKNGRGGNENGGGEDEMEG